MAQPKKKNGKTSQAAKQKKKADQSRAKAEIKEMQEKRKADKRVIDEIWGVIFIAVGIFLFAAVQFHAAGELGNTIGDVLKGVFGIVGLILPWYLVLFGILLFANKTVHISGKSFALVFLALLMICLINSGRFIDSENLAYDFGAFYEDGISLKGGGLFGMSAGTLLVKTIGMVGLYVFSAVVIIICMLLVINTPVSRGIEKIFNKAEEHRILKEKAREAEGSPFEEEEPVLAAPAEEKKPQKNQAMETQLSMLSGGGRDIRIITPYDDEGPLGRGSQSSMPSEKNRKSNVLKYMNDKDLFSSEKNSGNGASRGYGLDGETAARGTYGLEEKTDYGAGRGLDGHADYGGGYGLDGHGAKEEISPSAGDFSLGKAAAAGAAAGTAASGVIMREEPAKLSRKEAASVTLDPEEIAAGQKIIQYRKPPVSLLNRPQTKNRGNINSSLKMKAAKLEDTLRNFHVDAHVIQVTQGPAVTRYEIQPAVGVKVSSIVRLADDIALNLEARSIRIEAPIPGKAAVGIEVENDRINMVTLREIIDSEEFRSAESKITFAVGKDIAGKAVVADLKGMPHLLIAGSTGSGKSVCINSIITSILYKADPDEVKLILVDPKVVELGNYNGIPHLLIPVVTEPAKAAAALNWAVAEMTDRYKKFAENQVRDLESYNETMRLVGEPDQVMPQIVIIIDELADLMMAAPSQVEESICRLAQMARAAGMHLIVATQRPSVDVITGVIKANIPSRIAFAVSSQVDSRTILDMSGAEKLVGKGDMLFNPLGMGKPVRVQGTFVSDSEVHKVIEYVKGQVPEVEYSGDVMNTIEKGNLPQDRDDDGDELLPDAIECVVSAGQASVSMLQRRFRIGYNRAARIVDMMEARGIVGPQDGSRPRQVLLSQEELDAMKEEVENG
ncbi:MAG: DNA translocase FtsK 4TM domain-containing protein [Emergencia sp.]